MKHFLSTLTLAAMTAFGTARAQQAADATDAPPREPMADCATRLTAQDAVEIMRRLRPPQRVEEEGYASRYVFRVRVQFTIVREDNGTGGLDPAAVPTCLATLNAGFAQARIRFEEAGPVTFLNSGNYFNINNEAEFQQLVSTNHTPGSMHVFFVNTIGVFGGGNACGIATIPDIPQGQGVAIANACVPPGNSSTIVHEVGHWLNLYHTHETVFGAECPNGINCGPAGDRVCDTPADPNLSGRMSNVTCTLTSSLPSPPGGCLPQGQTYNPDLVNFMSYAPQNCRTRFTHGQCLRMREALLNPRYTYLIDPPNTASPPVTWLDYSRPTATGEGTVSNPYGSLHNFAVDPSPLPDSRCVLIGPWTSNETINNLARRVTLDAWHGPVTIGRQ